MWACREAECVRGCVVACVWLRYLKTWKEKGNHHKGHESETFDARCHRSVKAADSSPTLAHMPVPVNDAAELREVISKL